MRSLVVVCVLFALSINACKRRPPPVPERTTVGTNLNVGATAMTPEVHINQRDGGGGAGAMNIQIGNVNVQLPGENERGRAAEHEGEH